MIYRLIFSMCFFAIHSTSTITNSTKMYSYSIDVHRVDRCPEKVSEWQAATERMGCNDGRGYHCVPDKFHESLIEFCYDKLRILVSKGNCLELAADGILNQVKCHNFTWGCPDIPYLSDRLYNYPTCLNILFGCFISDIECIRQKVQCEENTTTKHGNITTESSITPHSLVIALCCFSTSLMLCIVFTYIRIRIYRKKKIRRQNQRNYNNCIVLLGI